MIITLNVQSACVMHVQEMVTIAIIAKSVVEIMQAEMQKSKMIT